MSYAQVVPIASSRRPGVAVRRGVRSTPMVPPAALFLAVLAVVVIAASLALSPGSPAPSGWSTVAVAEWGTLWELAGTHPVPGLSTAETVALIQAENNLSDSTLYAGQTLRVPAITAESVTVASR